MPVVTINELINSFSEAEKSLNGELQSEFHQLRRQALKRFAELGFPSKKDEDWKYTSLLSILNKDWEFGPSQETTTLLSVSDLKPLNLDADLLIMVDGCFRKDLSSLSKEGVADYVGALEGNLKEDNVGSHNLSTNSLAALNTAFFKGGLSISIPENIEVRRPVYILQISTMKTSWLHPRIAIEIGQSASLSVVEQHFNYTGAAVFVNEFLEANLLKDGHLDYVQLQTEPSEGYLLQQTSLRQAQGATSKVSTFTLGPKWVRNNLSAHLEGEHSNCAYNGLYLAEGDQHIDNHTFVDHAVPNCVSDELYKGIIQDGSKAVFNGKILVRRDAQNTNAFQSNKNIVLGESATVYTQPQLEIYADDVRCTHGATTGKLDKDAIFYMRSRGIDEKQARTYLLKSFGSEIIERLESEVIKDYLYGLMNEKLAV